MTANGFLQIALYLVVLLALAKPLGALHGARLRGRSRRCSIRVLGPVERLIYRALRRRARTRG